MENPREDDPREENVAGRLAKLVIEDWSQKKKRVVGKERVLWKGMANKDLGLRRAREP